MNESQLEGVSARARTGCYSAVDTLGGLSSILNSDCCEQLVQEAGPSS
jgi:hypothetical protein